MEAEKARLNHSSSRQGSHAIQTPLLELQVNEPLSPEPQAPQQERPLQTPFLDEQAQQQEQDQPAPSSFQVRTTIIHL